MNQDSEMKGKNRDHMSRRDYMKLMGAGAAIAALDQSGVVAAPSNLEEALTNPEEDEDRARRMKWWHEARFGMFVHWGLYSVLGHHEWAMENEAIPVSEYQQLAKQFNPKPNAAREWARLAG